MAFCNGSVLRGDRFCFFTAVIGKIARIGDQKGKRSGGESVDGSVGQSKLELIGTHDFRKASVAAHAEREVALGQ